MATKRRQDAVFAVFVGLLLAAMIAVSPRGRGHLQALTVLMHLSAAASADASAYETTDGILPTPHGPTRMRLYSPRVADPPAVVLVHGVHRLGIDEPRLVRLASELAGAGIRVLTPEVKELADYRIDPVSVETLGAAAETLATRSSRAAVGVIGVSFAGGLSILAASNDAYAARIAFVVAFGGHHDLARVLRFFATNEIPAPDGSIVKMHAHDYGPLVLLYGHTSEFFAPEDVAEAKELLRVWLYDGEEAAKKRGAKLSAAGQATLKNLFDHREDLLAKELLASVERHEKELALVSPSHFLAKLRAPLFLLHGAEDTVIPASESLWIAKDTPPGLLRGLLVTGAIEHVNLRESAVMDKLALVHFFGEILAAAGEEPR